MRHVFAFAMMAVAVLIAGCTDQTGVTCPPGQTLCGEVCVYTSSDPANCGACGNACQGDLVCISGVCGCPKGQTACNGECVNTASDVANCGACGTSCPAPQVCSMSMCAGSCATGLTNCNRDCVNLKTDDSNCGTCGAACGPGLHCQGGTCVQECPTGQTACNGKCVSLSSDGANCGACGNVCPNEYFCIFGSCILGCPQPLTRCVPDGGESDGGSQCVDTRFDPKNCGGCGGADVSPAPLPSQPPVTPHVCVATAGFNDEAICSNGRCDWVCAESMLDCDGNARPLNRISSPNGSQPPPGANIEEACVNPVDDNCNCGGCNNSCLTTSNEVGNPFWQQNGSGPNECFAFSFDTAPLEICCDSACTTVGDVNSCGNCAGTTDCASPSISPSPSSPACCPKVNPTAPPTTSDNHCVDLSNDFHNCGNCGNDCAQPQASLPPGTVATQCCFGEFCRDTKVTITNCGNGCNFDYQDCTNPSVLPSPSMAACCPGVRPSNAPMGNGCIDVAESGTRQDQQHLQNCGACGTDCTDTPCPSPSSPACIDGACGCADLR